MPTAVLVLLIVLAIAGGLYVGFNAGQRRSLGGERPQKSIGNRARETATKSMLGLWRWNRARKKKSRDESGSGD